MTLRNKTYFRDLDWQSLGTLLFQTGVPMAQVGRIANTLDNRQQFTGNQLEAVFRLGSGRVRHNILVGVEAAKRENDYNLEYGFFLPLDLNNPVDTDTFALDCTFMVGPLCPVQLGTAESTILAGYVVDQI
ncbi:MAG: hypothetical protein GTN89_01075, partial [Acidobacteria bacterium]|nr:hypothetical protein [Acidobacteriota bacterium]NIM60769.1 hypothetical protein [Acidobacteriota bacterium]NIO57982.1 hypothetical protein [Acidobacteriota bacterium]NIQ28987.1 hypothetical protein [Acidobacteriota bacterium]NIQ83459.1 hypothetical protein [Acidobacteriota bacterium]